MISPDSSLSRGRLWIFSLLRSLNVCRLPRSSDTRRRIHAWEEDFLLQLLFPAVYHSQGVELREFEFFVESFFLLLPDPDLKGIHNIKMHRLASWVVSALAASWVTASTAHVAPQFAAKSICPRGGKWVDELEVELVKNLSDSAEVYFPGSSEFEAASTRWSELDEPNVNVVVVPGTAEDVAQTVSYPPLGSSPDG